MSPETITDEDPQPPTLTSEELGGETPCLATLMEWLDLRVL